MGLHVVKKIFDIQNNRKMVITVKPKGFVVDSNDTNLMTKQFHPHGTWETYYYSSEEIVPDPDSLNDTGQYYFYRNVPNNQVYSLLRSDVFRGVDPLLSIADGSIISGVKPVLESVAYAGKDMRYLGASYGLVHKNEIYEDILTKLRHEMRDDVEDKCFVISINKQRSMQDFIFVCRGNVLNSLNDTIEGNVDTWIEGIKYHSRDLFHVDYYNDSIVPFKTKSTADQNNAIILPDNPVAQIPAPQQTRLITKIIDYEYFNYKYLGAEPLITSVKKETYLYLPFAIDYSSYTLLAMFDPSSNLSCIFIANPVNDDTAAVTDANPVYTLDIVNNGYVSKTMGDTTFYRQANTERIRYEDVIQANYNGITITYNCSQGLGKFDALQSIIMIGNADETRDRLSASCPSVSWKDFKNYTVNIGNRLLNLETLITMTSAGGKTGADLQNRSALILNDYVKATIGAEITSTSYTTQKPAGGKDRSVNVISSQKLTPTGQDFDSKSYIGGGLPYKTFVYPDSATKVTLGKTGLIKDVQVNGSFAGVGELGIVANNFYDSNANLKTISVNTQGLFDIDQISSILGGDFQNIIIDKVTYDYGQNGTVLDGRTTID